MRFEGTLKSWDDDRGFGFIQSDQGGDEIFVHIKVMVNRQGRPQIGQRLTFEVDIGPQGKKRAKGVMPYRAPRSIKPNQASRRPQRQDMPARWGLAATLAIPVFATIFIAVMLTWRPPIVVGLIYVAASLITFIVYAIDKSSAIRGSWRTKENSLHTLALVGGWPGALLAQQLLRHKSTKAEFRLVFWITVVLNVAAFIFLCSPSGRELWQR